MTKCKEINDIILRLREFRDQRNWKRFHTEENLAKSVSIEAAELLELYQWEDQPLEIGAIGDELADTMIYCLMLCDKLDLDPIAIINSKIDKNALKYPV